MFPETTKRRILFLTQKKRMSWSRLPDPPDARNFAASVTVGQYLYLLGGQSEEEAGGEVDTVHRFDLIARKWDPNPLPPLSSPRSSYTAVAALNFIHVLGGTDAVGNASDKFERFNVLTQTWGPPLPPLPSARLDHATVVLGDFIYLIGGTEALGNPTNKFERFNLLTQLWDPPLQPLPSAKTRHRAAALGNSIYVSGGVLPDATIAADFYRFDVTNPGQTWEALPALPLGTSLHTSEGVGDSVFVLGGAGATSVLDEFLQFSPSTPTWQPLPSLPTARFAHVSVFHGGFVYLLGGTGPQENSFRRLKDFHVFGPLHLPPTPTPTPTPTPLFAVTTTQEELAQFILNVVNGIFVLLASFVGIFGLYYAFTYYTR